MNTHKIAVIAGDGIGPEVISVGVDVLRAIAEIDGGFQFEFTDYPWGCEYYLKTGRMMPEDGIETLKQYDSMSDTDKERFRRIIEMEKWEPQPLEPGHLPTPKEGENQE